MATDNPQSGYTRIQGALKNVGHRVPRSTIANILKSEGIPPCRERSTLRGLVTYYTVFVIELWSRRVVVAGANAISR